MRLPVYEMHHTRECGGRRLLKAYEIIGGGRQKDGIWHQSQPVSGGQAPMQRRMRELPLAELKRRGRNDAKLLLEDGQSGQDYSENGAALFNRMEYRRNMEGYGMFLWGDERRCVSVVKHLVEDLASPELEASRGGWHRGSDGMGPVMERGLPKRSQMQGEEDEERLDLRQPRAIRHSPQAKKNRK